MVGAAVLIVLLVAFGPMLLDGGPGKPGEEELPPGQRGDEIRTHTFRLNESRAVAPSAEPVPPVRLAAEAPRRATAEDRVPAATSVKAPVVTPGPSGRDPEPAAAAGRQEPAAVLARVQDSTATEPAAAPARPEAAARSSGGWLVQIGTFGQKGNAERLSGALQKSGFDAFVSPTSRGEKTLYRVRVGPAGAKEEATQLAGRLGAAGHQGQVVPQ